MNYATLGFAVATVSWIATSAPAAVHQQPQQQSDHWTWHGRVAPGKTIEIRGINGSVSATPASGDEVEVTADKHGRRDDPSEVRIDVVPSDAGVTICAVYPGRGNSCQAGGGGRMSTHDNDVQVDFTVHVPRGVAFDGNTVNGDIDATDLAGPADVSTVNGSVTLETSSGQARAHTVNGGINATVRSLEGTGAMTFETVNGGVTIALPAGLNADFSAETVNGTITTDFPIQVSGRMTPRSIRGQIGSGGRELHVETVNGSVRLRRIGGQ